MQYGEFLEQYSHIHDEWSFGGIETEAAAAEIAQLSTLIATIEPAGKRAEAEAQLADFEAEISPESQDRMARAVEVIAAAQSTEGTVPDRIVRAQQGIADVTGIASETDDADERFAILAMNETLGSLLAILQYQSSGGARADSSVDFRGGAVRYEEFVAQYKQAHYDWSYGRIGTAEAAAQIARLRSEVPSIEPPQKRADAEYQLTQFAAEISPEAQDRMVRALDAIGAARSGSGSVDERIARAEQGMVAVTSIANESGNADERFAILFMNETLANLIESLRRSQGMV